MKKRNKSSNFSSSCNKFIVPKIESSVDQCTSLEKLINSHPPSNMTSTPRNKYLVARSPKLKQNRIMHVHSSVNLHISKFSFFF